MNRRLSSHLTILLARILLVCIPVVCEGQGVFSHQVPIKTPPGINGVQPNLSLVYSPGSGNGWLGVGWQLAGLSAISRVGYGRGINYDGQDTYAHSSLGVLLPQQDGSFRSKSESFAKVLPQGTCGDGPCSWVVYERSGTRYYYGSSSNSREHRYGTLSIPAWGLDKVCDLFGNCYEIQYWTSAEYSQLIPSLIKYTTGAGVSAYRTVEFDYDQTRTDTDTGNAEAGATKLTIRLGRITVKADGSPLRSYELSYEQGVATGKSHLIGVREYGSDGTAAAAMQQFEWQQGGAGLTESRWDGQDGAWVGGDQWQQHGVFIQGDFTNDGRGDVAWFHEDGGLRTVDVYASTGTSFQRSTWSRQDGTWQCGANWNQCATVLSADFSGDGVPDIAYIFNDNGSVSIDLLMAMPIANATTGYFSLVHAVVRQGAWRRGVDWQKAGQFLAGDFDGDGKSEVAYVYNDAGSVGVDVYGLWPSRLSRWEAGQATWLFGDAWASSAEWLVGDYDGDGKADIAYAYKDSANGRNGYVSVDVHQSTGTSFSRQCWENLGTETWGAGSLISGDFNGDGKTDLAFVVNDNGMVSVDVHESAFGDSTHLSPQRRGRYFYLTRWETAGERWSGGTQANDAATFIPGDFNGDGKTDLAYVLRDADGFIRVDVHISSGKSANGAISSFFLPPAVWESRQAGWVDGSPSWRNAAQIVPADVNGDGKMDLAYLWRDIDKITLDAHVANGPRPDLMVRVRNGLGGTTSIEYVSAPQAQGAVIAAMNLGIGITDTSPRVLVSSVTTDDGRTGAGGIISQVRYSYGDGRILPGTLSTLRNLGFAWVQACEVNTGQCSVTYNYQSPGMENRARETRQYARDSNGQLQLMSRATFNLEVVTPNAGTELVREVSRVSEQYEMGQLTYLQRATTSYDDFGNPFVRTTTGADVVVVTTQYANDVVNWVLGRVTEVKTTDSGGKVLGWMKNVWTGNVLTAKQDWLDTANAWIETRMEYYANGNLWRVTEPATGDGRARVTTTEYDSLYQTHPVRVVNALNGATHRTYTPDGLVQTATDLNNNVTRYDYDVFGRRRLETRPDGGTTEYYYDEGVGDPSRQNRRRVVKVDVARSITTREYYDGTGFVYQTQQTGDDGKSVCKDTIKDVAGRASVVSLPYYCNDRRVLVETVYDGAGRTSTVSTASDHPTTTRYEYGVGYTAITDPNGKTVRKNVDAEGRVTSIVDALGTTSFTYDPLGRVTAVTLPDNSTVVTRYDSLGRRVTTLDPQIKGRVVSYTYDALNRLKTKTTGDGTITYLYGEDEPSVRNGLGRVTTIVDASGSTKLAYDEMGRVSTKTTNIDGQTYAQNFTYDYADRVTRETYPDPDASGVEYVYTDGGNLRSVSVVGAGGALAEWSGYDAAGRPGHVSYGNAVQTDYTYEDVGQVKTIRTSSGSNVLQDLLFDWYSTQHGLNLEHIWDRRVSKVINGIDGDETQAFGYGPGYRLSDADGVWGHKHYEYDAAGNAKVFGGLGAARTLQYDGQQLVSGTGIGDQITYDAFGSMTHKNVDGVRWDYSWNADGSLRDVTRNSGQTPLVRMEYDASGARVKKEYTPASGPSVTTIYVGKKYERRTYGDGSAVGHTLHFFGNGQHLASVNRRQVPSGLAAGALSANWRQQMIASGIYNGWTIAGVVGIARAWLIVAVVWPNTGRCAGLALLAVLVVWVGGSNVLHAASVRSCKRRSRRATRRVRITGAGTLAFFVLAACGDGGGGEVGAVRTGHQVAGRASFAPVVGTYFYHRNHVNSSSVITNQAGVEVSRFVYVPYGEVSGANSSGTDAVAAKFTGQDLDDETGLYYFNARYYDPAVGRFISSDAVVSNTLDGQAYNRYAYARNNPVVYVDPSGHVFGVLDDLFNAVADAAGAVVSGLSAAATWVFDAAVDVVKFHVRAACFAYQALVGIVSDPVLLAQFVAGAVLSATLVGLPEGLAMWASATASAIAATSMAQAAGISNPLVLGLIGAMAGTVGATASFSRLPHWWEFVKTGGAWALNQGMQEVEGGASRYLSLVNGLASSMLTPTMGKNGKWVFTLFGAIDPDVKGAEGYSAYARRSPALIWSQGTGEWAFYDPSGALVTEGTGYSGFGMMHNYGFWEGAMDFGPIPVGEYTYGGGFTWKHMDNVMALTPVAGTDTYGRFSLLLHGGGSSGYLASEGCPILSASERATIAGYGGGTLVVVP